MGAGGGRPCHVFPNSTLGEHAAQGGGIGTMKTGTNQSHFPIPRGAGRPTFTNTVHCLLRGHRGGTEAVHSQTNILSWTNGPKASGSLGGYYSSVLQLGHLLPIRDHQGTGGALIAGLWGVRREPWGPWAAGLSRTARLPPASGAAGLLRLSQPAVSFLPSLGPPRARALAPGCNMSLRPSELSLVTAKP